MFKALLKTRMLALWHTMFMRSSAKKRGKGSKLLMGVLVVYVVVCMISYMAAIFGQLATGFAGTGLDWIYFALMSVMAFLLCFVGSVFMTQSLLFEAKDTEMLVSMPIPPRYIVASRFLPLFVLDYAFTLLITLPAYAVYCMHAGFNPVKSIIALIAFLILPFLSAAVTCLFGWVAAIVSSRTKSKTLIQTVISLALLVAYMAFCFNMPAYMQKLVANGEAIGAVIKKALPPFYWFSEAIASGNWFSLLKFALCCFIPFILVYALLSKSFLMISVSRKSAEKKKYSQGAMKVSGARSSLVKNELARFFSMSNYLLNCGIGSIMALLLAAVVLVKGDSVFASFVASPGMPSIDAYIPGLFCAAISFCAIMCNMSSVSLSLEGSSFPILKAMPLRAFDVFSSKIIANLCVGVPPIAVSCIVGCIKLNADILTKAAVTAACICAAVFAACYGAFLNAEFPKFDWTNATVVIKQSTSTMIYVFSAMAIVFAPCVLYAAVFADKNVSLAAYIFAVAGVLLLASVAFVTYLRKRGEDIYLNMG